MLLARGNPISWLDSPESRGYRNVARSFFLAHTNPADLDRKGIFDDYAWAAYSVLPSQTEWGHLQSTSGVSSIASHCGLQYFSVVT